MITFPTLPLMAGESGEQFDNTAAQAYLLEKLRSNDLVFMGTTHKQPAILSLLADLLPHLHRSGVTHLALEITSDQQHGLDRFLSSGKGLETIRLHTAIDCPEYRRLLVILGAMSPEQRPVVRALDLPATAYGTGMNRDQWMAGQLLQIHQENPRAKTLVVLGSMHVLRKLDWLPRIGNGNQAIRSHLHSRLPALSIFSIINIVGSAEPACDFALRLGPMPGAVAVDLDERYFDWRLGLTRLIALRPARPHELADGVIVY